MDAFAVSSTKLLKRAIRDLTVSFWYDRIAHTVGRYRMYLVHVQKYRDVFLCTGIQDVSSTCPEIQGCISMYGSISHMGEESILFTHIFSSL
jgi:hypothetical protein